MRIVDVPMPSTCAPIAARNWQSSATCGSQAALRISVGPLRLRRGEQRGLGAGDRRLEQIHRRAGQSAVGGFEAMARLVLDDARAHRAERAHVRRDRAARGEIAARRRQTRPAGAAEQRAQQQHRSAQPADQARIRLGRHDIAAGDPQRRRALPFDLGAERSQQVDHHRDVANLRNVAQLAGLGREQTRRQQRQRRVLVAFDRDAAGQPPAALNHQLSHRQNVPMQTTLVAQLDAKPLAHGATRELDERPDVARRRRGRR